MKIKLDENLPIQLVPRLAAIGHNVHTVGNEQLIGRADSEIWEAAQRESRFFITQDLDFSDLRHFSPGKHCGILLIRFRSPSRRSLADRILELFQQEDVNNWGRCFVVATERKIRVLKPNGGQHS